MITSEYLEQIVDLDQPILLVGPGLQYFKRDHPYSYKELIIPQDVALIWFAEKLAGKKGRIDVLDLDDDVFTGWNHGLRSVENYLPD